VVYVPWGLQRLVPLPRPLQLETESLEALQPYFDWRGCKDKILYNDNYCLIPSDLLGPQPRVRFPRISLLVFPNYRPGVDLKLTSLSRAQTVLALMECVTNARNLAGHGLREALRIAAQTPAYRLSYSDFAQLRPCLHDLLDKHIGSKRGRCFNVESF
jgi:hypothetical protein